MGYFKEKDLVRVIKTIDTSLDEATKSLNPNGGLINKWAFDESGDILLFQEYPCGCNKLISKIPLDIKQAEIEVIKEEEFVMQMEDILLEVNFSKSYEHLLFNVRDKDTISESCEICNNL